MLIYGWKPHGSKKLSDLNRLTNKFNDWVGGMTAPIIIMHDQEPLDFNLWSDNDFADYWEKQIVRCNFNQHHRAPERVTYQIDLHLRGLISPSSNLYDYVIITHSEQNSDQIDLYQQHGFLPVYFWSHALIAADWFRYATHDSCLTHRNINNITKDFLIYNRAWSDTREYRLTFAELVETANIDNSCLTSFSAVDNNIDYTNHYFANKSLAITSTTLHKTFKSNTHPSSASADYNNFDYSSTGIEVVLETLFDDTRWHLTEKTLRPIACGQPFILAATAGSLQYLQKYGFETFNGLINESYDKIADPKARLQAIVIEMQRIAAMPLVDKQLLWQKLYVIAARNKQRFFSQEWQTSIENEFYHNLNCAMTVMKQNCTGKYWKKSKTMPLSAGSATRSKQELQALEHWLAAQN
jgi:hypothetical protein